MGAIQLLAEVELSLRAISQPLMPVDLAELEM